MGWELGRDGPSGPEPLHVLVDEPFSQGHPQDLDVEAEGPVLDIKEVIFQPLLDRRILPQVVDLRPAGDPRLDFMAEHVFRDLLPEIQDKGRPFGTRSDQAHLAHENVDELGDLVDAEFSEELSEPCDARIIAFRHDRSRLFFSIADHGPELVDDEAAAVQPDALLVVEDRPLRSELNEKSEDQQQGGQQDEEQG